MKKIILAPILLLFIQVCYSQNNGYVGKKNLVEFNIGTYTPLLKRVLGDGLTNNSGNFYYYQLKNGYLQDGKQRVKVAFSASIIRSLSSRFNFGLEFGFQKLQLLTSRSYTKNQTGSSNQFYITGKLEGLDVDHFFFIPKIEFTKRDGIFGLGMSNQLGLGIGRSTFKEREYRFEMYDYSDYNSTQMTDEEKSTIAANMYDYSRNKFKNLILLYALTFRKAVSKSIFINYGFRYTYNFKYSQDSYDNLNNSYLLKPSQVANALKLDRTSNIIQFKIGATYIF